jgi:hypothetical protein
MWYGAAWLCGRVPRGYVLGCGVMRRGYVVSASRCCTAVPGSNPPPPRYPSLGSAQENPGAEKYRSRFFPAQQQEIPAQQRRVSPSPRMNIPAQQQACQPVSKDEYCINNETEN